MFGPQLLRPLSSGTYYQVTAAYRFSSSDNLSLLLKKLFDEKKKKHLAAIESLDERCD